LSLSELLNRKEEALENRRRKTKRRRRRRRAAAAAYFEDFDFPVTESFLNMGSLRGLLGPPWPIG
jgi:hypothetical protein